MSESRKEQMALVRKNPSRVEDFIAEGLLQVGDGYRAKNEELGTDGLPFARGGNIDDGFHFEGADRFPVKDLRKVGAKISRVGDVVFTSKGTVGRFAFVDAEVEPFVYSPQLCYWRSLDHQVIDHRWLYYWMQSTEFQDQSKGVAGQTDMADYVSLRDQRRFWLTLPKIESQRQIAAVMASLDDKIELNRRMNETLEGMARALFRSWFVDFDPVRAKAEGRPTGLPPDLDVLFPSTFTDSPLGPIPEGWSVRPLDEIADFLNGLALQKFPAIEGEPSLPVIKIAQLRKGVTADCDRASFGVPQNYQIKDGDLLFSWSGSLEVQVWTHGPGALNQHLFKVKSQEHEQWFVFLWLLEHLAHFRHVAASKATTMGHIQRSHLSAALCVVPDRRLERAVNSHIGPLHAQRIHNELEVRRLTKCRDELLPKLLSGEIEVGGYEEIELSVDDERALDAAWATLVPEA